MEVRLSVTNGKANVKQVVLGPETIIGRSSECNLKIASSQVSRRHCRITVSESDVRVCDLGSANGTYLNGRALPPDTDVVVAPGNALTIGPLRFVFHFKPPAPTYASAGPDADTRDSIPADLAGRPAPPFGEEETVDSQNRQSGAASPLGPPQRPSPASDEAETDFEEGLPDRTLAGLKKEAVEVSPPEGAADTVLDMNLEEEARRKAAQKGAAPTATAPGPPEVSESNTESGTALLQPAEAGEPAADHAAPLPNFNRADADEVTTEEADPERRSSRKARRSSEKKGWGLLGGMFSGKGRQKRPAGASDAGDETEPADNDAPTSKSENTPGQRPQREREAAALKGQKTRPQTPVPLAGTDEPSEIGLPVSFDEAASVASAAPEPAPAAVRDSAIGAASAGAPLKGPFDDPADFLMALSDEEREANLNPRTKPPLEKPVVGKPAEKKAVPRLTPEEKPSAKPGPAPQVKSGKEPPKGGDDPSLSSFFKNL